MDNFRADFIRRVIGLKSMHECILTETTALEIIACQSFSGGPNIGDCELGHRWTEGDCTDISGFLYDDLTIQYGKGFHRQCNLCGLSQTRKLTDWE